MANETLPEEGRRVCLLLDNAGWHKTKRFVWHHFEPVYLPPYSPDFNPIERIWQYLKGHGMAGYLSKKEPTSAKNSSQKRNSSPTKRKQFAR